MYARFVKPVIDTCTALIIITVTSPLFMVCVAMLYFANDGQVWFLQERPGKNGRPFKVIKFKTMNDKRDDNGHLLPDDQRLTRVGKFIRTTSLDELPQLMNILRGEMSLIGPRPLLMEYLPLYSQTQRRRHEVKPGITGWAQVNGRNEVPWKERFEYDVWYVDNISFSVDMKIFLRTIAKVVRAEGINSKTAATMEKFTGNE